MQILKDDKDNSKFTNGSVIVIGNFDGVHLGHQGLIEEAKKASIQAKLPLLILTFEPHPISFFKPDTTNYRLTSFKHKVDLVSKLGADYILALNFDINLANIEAKDFIKNYLVNNLKAKHIFVGYDFIFGKNRQGNGNLLEKMSSIYSYDFKQVEAVGDGETIYSSTIIRNSLKIGNTKHAAKILGRNYSIRGMVVKGKQLGRTIGFPTINIDYGEYLLPQNGVYAAKLLIENDKTKYNGVVNIGIKPTVNNNNLTVEMYIFDFNKDIYDYEVEVEFFAKIRNEQKFESLDQLKNQIKDDCLKAKQLLKI